MAVSKDDVKRISRLKAALFELNSALADCVKQKPEVLIRFDPEAYSDLLLKVQVHDLDTYAGLDRSVVIAGARLFPKTR